MNIEMLRHFLGWCAVLNYAVLMLWVILHIAVHPLFVSLSERFFHVGADQYDEMSLKGMLFYKLIVLSFNIVPYLALLILAR